MDVGLLWTLKDGWKKMKLINKFGFQKCNWLIVFLIIGGLIFRFWNFTNRIEFGARQAADLFLAKEIQNLGLFTSFEKFPYLVDIKILGLLPNPWSVWIGMEVLMTFGIVGLFFIGKKLEGVNFGLLLMMLGCWTSELVANVNRFGSEKFWFFWLILLLLFCCGRLMKKQIDTKYFLIFFLVDTIVWKNKIVYLGSFFYNLPEVGWIVWLFVGIMLVFFMRQNNRLNFFYLACVLCLFAVGLMPSEYMYFSWPALIILIGWTMWIFWQRVPKKDFTKYMIIAWIGFWILQNKEIVFKGGSGKEIIQIVETIEKHSNEGVRVFSAENQKEISWPVVYFLDKTQRLKTNGHPVFVYKNGEKTVAGWYDLNQQIPGIEEVTKEKIIAF